MSEHVGDPNTANPECECYWCGLLRYAQDEVARQSPWCGACNPAAKALFLGSPGYRRWFLKRLRSGGDMRGIPVPTQLDPTVTP